jgi:hypothetical protein
MQMCVEGQCSEHYSRMDVHTKMSVGKHEERPIARSGSRCENRTKEVSRRAQRIKSSIVTVLRRLNVRVRLCLARSLSLHPVWLRLFIALLS